MRIKPLIFLHFISHISGDIEGFIAGRDRVFNTKKTFPNVTKPLPDPNFVFWGVRSSALVHAEEGNSNCLVQKDLYR